MRTVFACRMHHTVMVHPVRETVPRVFFDRQIEALQTKGGILTYFESLQSALSSQQAWLRALEGLKIKSDGRTVLHHTFYVPFFPTRFCRLPKVVTVYDFIPEASSGFRARHAHMAKKSYIKKADGVIFISETVRRQAFGLGYRPKLWAVTPLASRFRSNAYTPLSDRPNDVLYVGRRDGYKNFSLVPEALGKIVPRPKLTIVGGGRLSKSERKQLVALKVDYEHIESASDEQLEQLYKSSKVCVVPSLQEGFGLPLLEAMSLGCPVIAMDTAISREVAGDAATLISDSDPDAWADAIYTLLSDSELWQNRSEAGLTQSEKFDWKTTAALTANLYERVLAAGGK